MKNPIVNNIRTTTSIQGVETDLHLMIGSREVTSADKVRSEPVYGWMEIALRIARPLGERLFDRQAGRCVDIRSMVTNGEAPLAYLPCEGSTEHGHGGELGRSSK